MEISTNFLIYGLIKTNAVDLVSKLSNLEIYDLSSILSTQYL